MVNSGTRKRVVSLILICVFGVFLYVKIGSFLYISVQDVTMKPLPAFKHQTGRAKRARVDDEREYWGGKRNSNKNDVETGKTFLNTRENSSVNSLGRISGNLLKAVEDARYNISHQKNGLNRTHVGGTSATVVNSSRPMISTDGPVAEDRLGNTTHYFTKHPTEDKTGNLLLQCISKLPSPERDAYYDFWSTYRDRTTSSPVGRRAAHAWEALRMCMKSFGRRQRLPQVINIGAKKSGTTALYWFLSFHPEIVTSIKYEVHFFDRYYDKGLDYYRAMMGFAKDDQLVFEKTPRYFVTDSAPAKIAGDLPSDVKFILCVRDPLDRALSDFRHESFLTAVNSASNKIKTESERALIIATKHRAKFSACAFDDLGLVNPSCDQIRTSSYVSHFKNWLSYFPRERFLIVDHQRIRTDPLHELKRIENFLGLTPYFKEDMFYFDGFRGGTCMLGASIRSCPPRSNPSKMPRARVTSEQAMKLRDYFRPLNREFVKLVGEHNFTWVEL